MSLNSLSRLLIEPPSKIDPATVTGKMNAVTVGIVFANTGTKQTTKGSAFCILEIGSFVSGPCVTVMLFGDVYSKYVRTCVPGKVRTDTEYFLFRNMDHPISFFQLFA